MGPSLIHLSHSSVMYLELPWLEITRWEGGGGKGRRVSITTTYLDPRWHTVTVAKANNLWTPFGGIS
eukprot:1375865-Amorphochlora_amoeboformis.AAC.2